MGETRNQSGEFGLPAMQAAPAGDSLNSRPRPTTSLAVYVCIVFIGGALLAPWLYWLVNHLAPSSSFATKPFHRYLDRSLLALAIVGIWPLLRYLNVTAPLELFIPSSPHHLKRLGRGALLGFASLACVTGVALAVGARQFALDVHGAKLVEKLAMAAATAIAVALVEEFLFRGAIFGAFRRVWNWRVALLASSVIYAVVHFLSKTDLTGPVTWHSGLDLLLQMFSALANPREALPAMLSLTVVGVALGLAYQRTGDLYFSIGLHAGWVFWLKTYGLVTAAVPNTGAALTRIAGSHKVLDGWLALAVVLALWLVIPRMTPVKTGETRP